MRALALAALAACGDSSATVSPVVDLPVNDTASAFPLDALTLSIAHEGAAIDLASADFQRGADVSLGGVPFGDDLVIHMTGRVGTSEVAYGRTCSFAVNQSTVPAPHLLFSRSVKFAQLVDVPELRQNGVAITYHDGSGLVLGGVDPSNAPVGDIERFDPRTGLLRVLATVPQPRVGAVVASLGTGSDALVALIGGLDPSTGAGATFFELIAAESPPGRRVNPIDDANMSRIGLTATALTDGRVIAIGGMPPPSGPPSDAVDEISVSSGTASVRPLRALLAHPRTGHTATRLNDDTGAAVLITGGLDAAGLPVGPAELFKPLSEDFSKTFTATMVVPRSRHHAVRMPDDSVLIIGGVDASNNPVPVLELFTLDAGFKPVGTACTPPQTCSSGSPCPTAGPLAGVCAIELPATAGLVDIAATTLPDGRVLLSGGRLSPGGPAVDTAFITQLDPIDGSVNIVATDHLSVARAGHQATLMCDGTVLVAGGTPDAQPAERYNPPAAGRR